MDDSDKSAGSALARSSLSEHEGTRTVVLHFLKIIVPVECVIPLYDGYVMLLKEGELHRFRKTIKTLDMPAWSVNIDIPNLKDAPPKRIKKIRGLQFLWDT